MPRFTYNLELDSSPDRLGRWAIMLRVHKKDCKPARLGTGEWLQKPTLYWAAKVNHKKPVGDRVKWGAWVVRHPDSEAINTRLKNRLDAVQKRFDAWLADEPLLTPAEARDRFENPVREDYIELANEAVETMMQTGSVAYSTALLRQSMVKTLGKFLRPGLTLQQLTTAEVERFQHHLRYSYRDRYGQPLKASSINQYLDSLNAVHLAILMRQGLTRQQARKASPYVEVDKLSVTKSVRTRLSEAQIESASQLETPSVNQRLSPDEAFQVWLLAYLLAGARFSDVLFMRYRDFELDGEGQPIRLNYEMKKTGTLVNFALGRDARRQLARWWKPHQPPTHYLLPFVANDETFAPYLTRQALKTAPLPVRKRFNSVRYHWNTVFNKRLKAIQAQLNLPTPLSFHASRHSFADLARRVMQEDKTLTLLDISLMLGQRDPKMVMVYIEEMEKQDADRPMQAVFDRQRGQG